MKTTKDETKQAAQETKKESNGFIIINWIDGTSTQIHDAISITELSGNRLAVERENETLGTANTFVLLDRVRCFTTNLVGVVSRH